MSTNTSTRQSVFGYGNNSAGQSFDLVMSFGVLEHVVDADRSMQEVFRCLDGGGTFIWTAPAPELAGAHQRQPGKPRRQFADF